MAGHDDQTAKSPEEARAGEKKGVWKILIVSAVLATVAMIAIGQFGG